MVDDSFCQVQAAAADELEQLGKRYLDREGVDLRFQEVSFLELSDLGDAPTLRQRLSNMEQLERRNFVVSVDQQGRTGLILAVSKGDCELVDTLLDHNANPNQVDSSGTTALHYAAERGASKIVFALLRACANVDAKDDHQGEHPLMWSGCANTAHLLIEARADLSARNRSGKTALMCAAARGNPEVVDVLARAEMIRFPACLETQDCNGRTAIALAEAAGHNEVITVLTNLGAMSATKADATNRIVPVSQALLDAASRGDAEACKYLLQVHRACADVELAGETPLLAAVSSGRLLATSVLLEARADVNIAERYLGETPLIRAVLGRASDELIWFLLEKRADATKADFGGRKPADIAESWGRHDAAEILRAAVAGEFPYLASAESVESGNGSCSVVGMD